MAKQKSSYGSGKKNPGRSSPILKNIHGHRPSLNLREAATYLGLTERQMRRIHDRREIPFWRTSHSQQGAVMFHPDDLDVWVDAHRVEAIND